MNYRIIYYTIFFINITGLAKAMDSSQRQTSLVSLNGSIARARRSVTVLSDSTSSRPTTTSPEIPRQTPPDLAQFVFMIDPLDMSSPSSGHLPACDAAASISSSSSDDKESKLNELPGSMGQQLADKLNKVRQAHRKSICETARRKSVAFSDSPQDPFAVTETSTPRVLASDAQSMSPSDSPSIIVNCTTRSDSNETTELPRATVAQQDGMLTRMRMPMILGATSATSVAATWLVMKHGMPEKTQKRSMVPFVDEAKTVLFGAGMVAKLAAGTAFVVTTMVAGGRLNSWLHSACESKQDLLKRDFEGIMKKKLIEHEQRTVAQITEFGKQVDATIIRHKEDTDEMVGHLVDAMEHTAKLLASQPEEAAVAAPSTSQIGRMRAVSPRAGAMLTAATELAVAAGQARSDMDDQRRRVVHIVPPTPPAKIEAGCCCCVS